MTNNVSHETQPAQPATDPLMGLALLIETTTGISVMRMKGKQRTKKVVEARRIFACMAHSLDYSYSEIGRFLNKHHSSVMDMVDMGPP